MAISSEQALIIGSVLLFLPPIARGQFDFQPCSPVNYLSAYPGDCGRFLACATFGYVPMDCPGTLAFNERRQVCDYKAFVPECAGEEMSRCRPNPCGMYGSCAETPLNPRGFQCDCLRGYTGDYCTLDINECNTNNPCAHGTCKNSIGSFYCDCEDTGYSGKLCDISPSEPCIDGASCLHGSCVHSVVNQCECFQGYTGTLCETNINNCSPNPCRHGGRCTDLVNDYACECSGTGYVGDICDEPGECVGGFPCVNGSCIWTPFGNQCGCKVGFTGTVCDANIDDCAAQPCLHGGNCTDLLNGFECNCTGTGYTGDTCQIDPETTTTQAPQACTANTDCVHGTCVPTQFGNQCECDAGYTGTYCDTEINECSTNPCMHGGQCFDMDNGFFCDCSGTAYTGSICQLSITTTPQPSCIDSTDCVHGICVGSLEGKTCSCNAGYTGSYCETEIRNCLSRPCQNGGVCSEGDSSFTCDCTGTGFTGTTCEQAEPVDLCEQNNPCNFGTCIPLNNSLRCDCTGTGYTGFFCDIKESVHCASTPCQHGGRCSEVPNGFTCDCTGTGYTGQTCETEDTETTPAPTPCSTDSDCVHGQCVPTQFGNQCACLAGYTGTYCEIDINECFPNPCENGGQCYDRVNGFFCDCSDTGYSGTRCHLGPNTTPQTTTDVTPTRPPCSTSADCGQGICVGTGDDKACSCYPGYTGSYCEVEIDECSSEPCQNGGLCIDGINTFTCNCTGTGFTGTFCQTRQTPDYCARNPCNTGRCTNVGDSFECDCTNTGFTGTFCDIPTTSDPCASNPCLNGQCRTETETTFTCDCSGTSFSGQLCEVPAVGPNDCDPNPCEHGVCTDLANGFNCDCSGTVYSGRVCEFTECNILGYDPCRNGGTCISSNFEYTCACAEGFTGGNCETIILPESECSPYVCPRNVPRQNYPAWNDTTCSAYYNCEFGVLSVRRCPAFMRFDVITMECQLDTGPPRFFCDSFLL